MSTQRKSARPRFWPANAESPTLLQFVLLSMLLHMLMVVLFGNTISGGARRGDGWLGPLDVTLRQMSPERGSGFSLAPGADTNLPGTALLRRREGSTTATATMPQGNAATRGATQEPPSAAPVPPAPASTDVSESAPEVSLSPQPPPVESLPRLDRSAPVEVDKPLVSPAILPPKVSPPAPEQEIAPRAALPERDEPIAPTTTLEPIAPPVEMRQREVPIAPRPPSVERPQREEPAPVEPITPAKIEREQAPAVEVKPRDMPMPSMAPIEGIVPPMIERSPAPPLELPAPRKAPQETPTPARIAPTPEREAASVAPPLPRNGPVEIAPGRERAAPTPARTETPAGGDLPRLRYGAPDVDEEVFRSRRDVVAPTTEPGGAPGITAESLRGRAREMAREGSGTRGVLNVVPPPPPQERKDTLAEGIAKAAKPDCRTAYAGMGLLAVVPLVASSVGNGGCRW